VKIADIVGIVLMVALLPITWLAGKWIAPIVTTFLGRKWSRGQQ